MAQAGDGLWGARDTARREETGGDPRGEHEGEPLTYRVGSRSPSSPCPPDRSTPAEIHVGGRTAGHVSSMQNRAKRALWLRMPAEAQGEPMTPV